MSDPMPPEEWSRRVDADDGGDGHAFPPRPDVVQVTEPDLVELADGASGHEGHRPSGVPIHPTPDLVRPEVDRPAGAWPRWRRPAGQQDDKGEPTTGGTGL